MIMQKMLAASLSRLYWAWFALILSSRTLILSVKYHFYNESKRYYLKCKELSAGNVVSTVKKNVANL